MTRRFFEAAGSVGLFLIILLLVSGWGCSRSDSPEPQKSQAPVTQQAPAPAQAPPPATYAQPTTPPATTPQYATPSQPTAVQPQAAIPQNFTQVQLGMTSAQIRQIMGEPTQIKQEGHKVEFKYYTPQGKCEVEFVNDRVVSMEWH